MDSIGDHLPGNHYPIANDLEIGMTSGTCLVTEGWGFLNRLLFCSKDGLSTKTVQRTCRAWSLSLIRHKLRAYDGYTLNHQIGSGHSD